MGRRILVTGGSGFLGSHVLEKLQEIKNGQIIAPSSREYDLTNPFAVREMMEYYKPKKVLHLAASCGGIGANLKHPGKFFYDNIVMGIHLIEESRKVGVQKFICVGTVCAYPKNTPVPFKEDDIWDGYPEETNAPYGVAKKSLLVQLQSYRQEYGFNGIYLLPVNLYGPRDNFDLETSHVVPAMIRKFNEAKCSNKDEVVFWGSGSVSREFLFVRDCADGIIKAVYDYDGPDPINLGSGEEIEIRRLAQIIKKIVGFRGRVIWDKSKPDGQPRRCLDTTRAKSYLKFEAQTSLEDGLAETFSWYRSHC